MFKLIFPIQRNNTQTRVLTSLENYLPLPHVLDIKNFIARKELILFRCRSLQAIAIMLS